MFSFTLFGNEDVFYPKTLNTKHFQGSLYMVSILLTQANINRFKPFSQCLIFKYSRILSNALSESINLVNLFNKSIIIMSSLHLLLQFNINPIFFHITMHLLDRTKIESFFSMLSAFSVPKISLFICIYFYFGRIGSNFPFNQKFGLKLPTLKPKRWKGWWNIQWRKLMLKEENLNIINNTMHEGYFDQVVISYSEKNKTSHSRVLSFQEYNYRVQITQVHILFILNTTSVNKFVIF